MQPVNIGICGLGTVGGGTFNVLQRNAKEISRRAGRGITVSHIGTRRDNSVCDVTSCKISRDIFDVVADPDITIIVELIGGCDIAFELVMAAIKNGKHVVTANKALIALHGNEIFNAAQQQGVMVAFEASVAGGIPIIKTVREGLAANQIDWLVGIINGTSNYILTEMAEKQREFADVLKEAQALGYAEADPTFDVEGVDAAHKLTILASIAFGVPLQFSQVYTEGITQITPDDMVYATEFGYHIKHLGITRRQASGIEMRVHPTLIPNSQLMANVNGVMNAVMVQGDAVGPTVYCGAGAGAEPTASAVVADIIDVVRVLTSDQDNRVPHLAFQPDALVDLSTVNIEDIFSGYYLRMKALDQPGVLAEAAGILSQQGISIEALTQRENQHNNENADQVTIVMLTNKVQEKCMNTAIEAIEKLAGIVGKVMRIRVEQLDN